MKKILKIHILITVALCNIMSAQAQSHEQQIVSVFQQACIDTEGDVSRIEALMAGDEWAELTRFDTLSLVPRVTGPDFRGWALKEAERPTALVVTISGAYDTDEVNQSYREDPDAYFFTDRVEPGKQIKSVFLGPEIIGHVHCRIYTTVPSPGELLQAATGLAENGAVIGPPSNVNARASGQLGRRSSQYMTHYSWSRELSTGGRVSMSHDPSPGYSLLPNLVLSSYNHDILLGAPETTYRLSPRNKPGN